MRKEGGFTLIELLIVLAILGILVGIVAMSVGGLTTAANTTAQNAELDIVRTAIDTWDTQDAAVGGADPISDFANVKITKAAASTYPFVKYLRADTKYAYTYTASTGTLANGK